MITSRLNQRLLRPLNMAEGTPGKGIVQVTNAAGKRLVAVNLMTNLFMAANDPVFPALNDALVRNKLGRDADFILIDVHGEATSEKMALGHYADGRASLVVGTHTHVPTADHRVFWRVARPIRPMLVCAVIMIV